MSDDFDFLFGAPWNVANRRLVEGRWPEFPGTATVRPILGGVGNFDEIDFPTLGAKGATLRLFNTETQEWSIYGMSARTGTMFPPVVGGFADGRGEVKFDSCVGERERVGSHAHGRAAESNRSMKLGFR